jgi:hypothetical protein
MNHREVGVALYDILFSFLSILKVAVAGTVNDQKLELITVVAALV